MKARFSLENRLRSAEHFLIDLVRCGLLRSTTYRGHYSTYLEAQSAAPKARKLSYDHEEAAELFIDDVDSLRIKTSDYPTIYWLQRIIRDGSRVFDWGGNLGRSYYPYQRYISYPQDFDWLICDVPEVIRAGEELARRRHTPHLRFTDRPEDCDGCEILLAFGSLQFIERSLQSLLVSLSKKPAHLLINRTPVHPHKNYYTLQDVGPVLAVYHVFSEDDFLRSIESCGYRLLDRWSCHGTKVRVPFYSEGAIEEYSGFYFEAI